MNRLILNVILTISLMLNACNSRKTEIIAHRGASGMEIENTLEAVKRAIDLKSDAVEVDIWRTKDDSLVVFHDRNTGRLSDDTLEIPESTFQELRNIDLVHDRKIPNLRDVLEMLPNDKRLFIEIKCCWEQGEAGNVFPMLPRLLKDTGTENQVAIISFNPQKLKDAFHYLPDVPRYLLLWKKVPPEDIVNTALDCHADGIDVHYDLLSEEMMGEAKKNNLEVYVWTVNSPEKAREMIDDFGIIDGITTDFPGLILNKLNTNGHN